MRKILPITALALTAAGSAMTIAYQVPADVNGQTAAANGTSAGQYADGTWLGAAVAEPWGTFQVQAVVSGGQLTDVVVVSAPGDGHSSRINSSSIPVLTSQALAAQSASVDAISGATWTSQSYATSLQAALDDAAAAATSAS